MRLRRDRILTSQSRRKTLCDVMVCDVGSVTSQSDATMPLPHVAVTSQTATT
jgi:hypothetical protein